MATQYTSASLYVGDLRPDVTESTLFEIFKNVGSVASIRVCRDAVTRRSLGYAYVNFHTSQDAEHALDTMNFTTIAGKPCRIMWSHRDPALRKSSSGNIFIKNLDKEVNNQQLYDTFSNFGNILSCKVETDDNGQSKGYGYVHFEKDEDAANAIAQVNGKQIKDKVVFVGPFVSRRERNASLNGKEARFTNVYVKNLDAAVTDAGLREMFAQFGAITSAVVVHDQQGASRCFGFCNFETHEAAKAAVAEMHNKNVNGKQLYVSRAQKRNERDRELKSMFDKVKAENPRHAGVNLYVRNLDDTIDDDELRSLFQQFGTIASTKVMRDDKAASKGFGFVSFSTPEDALKAISEMNGAIVHNKPFYVALAQKKEDRRATLEQIQLSRRTGMYPPTAYMNPQMGWYAGVPPQGQRVMFPPAMVQQRGGWGPRQGQRGPYAGVPYAQQAAGAVPQGAQGVPQGGRPNAGNYGGRPMIRRGPAQGVAGQQGVQRGRVAGGAPMQRNQQQQYVVLPAAVVPGQAAAAPVVAAVPAAQPQAAPAQQAAPAAQVAMPAVMALSPEEYATLAPEDLKNAIGERLFQAVYMKWPVESKCGKITGMLLESMLPNDLNALLADPAQLNQKIEEANVVYENHQRKQAEAADQQQPQPVA
eukprot:m51a1_g9972 putative polyadenylate-binding protein 4 (645) ;mRNA; f:105013-107389